MTNVFRLTGWRAPLAVQVMGLVIVTLAGAIAAQATTPQTRHAALNAILPAIAPNGLKSSATAPGDMAQGHYAEALSALYRPALPGVADETILLARAVCASTLPVFSSSA